MKLSALLVLASMVGLPLALACSSSDDENCHSDPCETHTGGTGATGGGSTGGGGGAAGSGGTSSDAAAD